MRSSPTTSNWVELSTISKMENTKGGNLLETVERALYTEFWTSLLWDTCGTPNEDA